jgi:hypothetical protein
MIAVDGVARSWLALAAVACVVTTAGCGGASARQVASSAAGTTSGGTTSGEAASSSTPAAAISSRPSHPQAGSASTSRVPAGSSTVPTTSVPATSALPARTPAVRARTAAGQACARWQRSETQDASTATQTDRAAASVAATGAALDHRWASLAGNMQFVASLPETGNPPSTVATARADLRAIQQTCAALGVRITT